MEYVEGWQRWMKIPAVLNMRYEDLLQNYDIESARLARFLGLRLEDQAVKEVVQKYRPAGDVQARQGTHFYKGQVGRFRERYSTQEQKILAEKFGPYLEKMGYEV